MGHVGRHAIVLGGSLGGLLAARALAAHYEHVTVLERDRITVDDAPRRGSPQARHAHGLLARGREGLAELFPGLTDGLIARGALPGDVGVQARWFNNGAYQRKVVTGLQGLLVSRPLLEAYVRSRLRSVPTVQIEDGCDVVGLTSTDDRRYVTGVRVRHAGAADAEDRPADLVVDATGRGSRAPAWLATLGYAAPAEERVQVDVMYATRHYRRQPAHLDGDHAAIIAPSPPGRRGGVILAQEGGRWIVSLAGCLGEQVPTDELGFVEYARSLPAPEIYDVVRNAEPLGEPAVYRFPASHRRRYERLARFPEGLLVLGDAFSSFNPIYGQGMTVAVLEALALRDCLSEGASGLAARFFRRAAALVDTPWSIAVGGDLRYPEVVGPRSPLVRFVNWYLGRLHVAARRRPEPADAFLRVANLAAPPASLLGPRVALAVLRGCLAGPARPGPERAAQADGRALPGGGPSGA